MYIVGGSKGAAPLLSALEWDRCNVVESPPFKTAGLIVLDNFYPIVYTYPNPYVYIQQYLYVYT